MMKRCERCHSRSRAPTRKDDAPPGMAPPHPEDHRANRLGRRGARYRPFGRNSKVKVSEPALVRMTFMLFSRVALSDGMTVITTLPGPCACTDFACENF